MLFDAHIHASALPLEAGESALAVTCEPAEYTQAKERSFRAALGLHPWRINNTTIDDYVEQFFYELPNAHYIGEIGLDFYKDYAQFNCAQSYVLHSILAMMEEGSYIVSLHSRSADIELLDHLGYHDTHRSSTCILHGFNGSSQAMTRAVEMGCVFSLGPRQLKTKRGREYARQLPADRILLETDFDNPSPVAFEEWQRTLQETLDQLNAVRGTNMDSVIENNVNRIFK